LRDTVVDAGGRTGAQRALVLPKHGLGHCDIGVSSVDVDDMAGALGDTPARE
jgi:hypothetical protein